MGVTILRTEFRCKYTVYLDKTNKNSFFFMLIRENTLFIYNRLGKMIKEKGNDRHFG